MGAVFNFKLNGATQVKNKIFLMLAILSLVRCSHSELERHATVSVKNFQNAPLNKLWESLLHVVQAEGYAVESEDKNKGVIIAAIQRTPGLSDSAVSVRTLGHLKEELYKIILNVRKGPNNSFTSRLSFQIVRRHSLGGFQGEEIVNPDLYQDFYRKVESELGAKN